MKREMAGKILSEVSGSSETKEETAKELKATRTRNATSFNVPNRNMQGQTYEEYPSITQC